MDLGQWLVIGFCVLLLAWFICGAAINYRRAGVVLEWLKAGMSELGELGITGWMTALHSAARLAVRELRPPFRTAELFFVLEARENLLVWAFRHMLGRRDELFVRAELRSAPAADLEAAYKTRRANSVEHYDITYAGEKGEVLSGRLKQFLAAYPDAILKFTIRRKSPHIFMRINLDRLRTGEAGAFFAALRAFLV